jgi:hypothetical protein
MAFFLGTLTLEDTKEVQSFFFVFFALPHLCAFCACLQQAALKNKQQNKRVASPGDNPFWF